MFKKAELLIFALLLNKYMMPPNEALFVYIVILDSINDEFVLAQKAAPVSATLEENMVEYITSVVFPQASKAPPLSVLLL